MKPLYFTSDVGKIRYAFEHQILRDQFFSNPSQLIRILMVKDGLYELSSIISQKMAWNNPYSRENIQVDVLRWNGDINLISIQFPEPEYSPLCYRVHLFFSDDFSTLGYYTIECGIDDNAFLCAWDKADNHKQYNEIKSAVWPDEQKGLWKAIEAHVLIDLHAENNKLNPNPDKNEQPPIC